MLYISTEEEFMNAIPDIQCLAAEIFLSGEISHKAAFEKMFGFSCSIEDGEATWTQNPSSFAKYALWTRMAAHVSTCSNHAERFHRTV
jgi:hypothetical protein